MVTIGEESLWWELEHSRRRLSRWKTALDLLGVNETYFPELIPVKQRWDEDYESACERFSSLIREAEAYLEETGG
jgi:hypothetical protein